MVLQVRAARNPSPLGVVSCTTISPTHAILVYEPRIPADILHCKLLVAAAVAADHKLHSLAVARDLPAEVDSLNKLVGWIEVSECP